MEIKIIIDKKGHVIRKLVTEKRSINSQIDEIISKSQILQSSLAQTEELNDLSKKAVYYE